MNQVLLKKTIQEDQVTQKDVLRRQVLNKRAAVGRRQRDEAAAQIAARVRSLRVYRDSSVIMSYLTHGSELQTEPLIRQAWNDGKKVCVPVTGKQEYELSAYAITSLEDGFVRGFGGVREPLNKSAAWIHYSRIGMVIVPGIAFDRRGNRLGYGAGCYDRWLERIPLHRRVGICYECQLLPHLPAERHDVPVGLVVTEKRIIRNMVVLRVATDAVSEAYI